MVNTNGLILTGTVCRECGLIHPPIDGPCPMVNTKIENIQKTTKKTTPISRTHDKEEIKIDNKISLIMDELTNLINKKTSNLKFENEYASDKFYKILHKTVIENTERFFNEYKQ